ncbi:hypothetical protein [Bradyrhizobium elkanii]|uniref:hypothetical protein n=1 Tax=Bradyrhizobium elkanii TaxID=29448 RepID=UPI003516BEFA
MESKFKVGQVWKRRNGERATISAVDQDGLYPVYCELGRNYTTEGLYIDGSTDTTDLVELVSDVAEEAPAPAPTFAVGQVWERRDGRTVRIARVEPAHYHGELVVEGEDGHWRRRSARISDVTESPYDLVQLLPVTEPSAPAIADAMIADAAALAPQHDAEANGEPSGTIEVERRDAVVSAPRATSEERALFDALVMQAAAMGNFSNPGTEKVLSTIREIIEARRAL